MTEVENLLKDIKTFKSGAVYEDVISGIVLGSIGILLPVFSAESSLCAVYQAFVPCKLGSSIDISLMNYADEKRPMLPLK
jgi:hypothetical protein